MPPELVRDYIVAKKHITIPQMQKVFSVSIIVAMNMLQPFIDRGVIEKVADPRTDSIHFQYVPPPKNAPNHRPSGERQVLARIAEWTKQHRQISGQEISTGTRGEVTRMRRTRKRRDVRR